LVSGKPREEKILLDSGGFAFHSAEIGDQYMRIVLADIEGNKGYLNKDTVAGP